MPVRSHVLVVEDDSTSQILIGKMILKVDRQAEVHFARSVDTAVELMKLQKFELVISDQRLIGSQTGLELYRICQSESSGTPFILISGSKVLDLGKGNEDPVFFQKPLPPFRFRVALQKLLFENIPELQRSSADVKEKVGRRKSGVKDWSILAIVGIVLLAGTASAIRFAVTAPSDNSRSHVSASPNSTIPTFRFSTVK